MVTAALISIVLQLSVSQRTPDNGGHHADQIGSVMWPRAKECHDVFLKYTLWSSHSNGIL